MHGVISHHVKRFVRSQPLVHSRYFAIIEEAVKIATQVSVYLQIEGGEKPPIHWEKLGGIGDRISRESLDITEVEVLLAGELTKLWQDRIVGLVHVIIQSEKVNRAFFHDHDFVCPQVLTTTRV